MKNNKTTQIAIFTLLSFAILTTQTSSKIFAQTKTNTTGTEGIVIEGAPAMAKSIDASNLPAVEGVDLTKMTEMATNTALVSEQSDANPNEATLLREEISILNKNNQDLRNQLNIAILNQNSKMIAFYQEPSFIIALGVGCIIFIVTSVFLLTQNRKLQNQFKLNTPLTDQPNNYNNNPSSFDIQTVANPGIPAASPFEPNKDIPQNEMSMNNALPSNITLPFGGFKANNELSQVESANPISAMDIQSESVPNVNMVSEPVNTNEFSLPTLNNVEPMVNTSSVNPFDLPPVVASANDGLPELPPMINPSANYELPVMPTPPASAPVLPVMPAMNVMPGAVPAPTLEQNPSDPVPPAMPTVFDQFFPPAEPTNTNTNQ